ncbi:phage late control D family protein [Sorangium sp. So ce124]|uniref:phage late control D family protein n=1 Tax=Sorangium sp. So ce124 TaxID=3133280 RepID=UPI003F5E739D
MGADLFYRVSVDASGAGYDLSGDIVSLTVEQRDAQPDSMVVTLSDPYKVLSHAVQEGMDVEVELGTSDDHALVFAGRIYRVDGSFPENGVPTLRVQAYDRSMKMGLKRRNRPFTDMALSDIVRNVAGLHGFASVNVDVVGDPRFTGNGIRQQDKTDLDFLLELARTYGCVMYVRPGDSGDTLHFVSQYTVMMTEPSVTLHYGRAGAAHPLYSFQSSANVSDVELPRVLSGIDFDTGQATSVTTAQALEVREEEDPFFDENLTAFRTDHPVKAAQLEVLIGAASATQAVLREELGTSTRQGVPTFTTEAELNTLAQNQFSTSLRGMRGSGSSPGIKEMFARSSVSIQDVGGRFSGTWYLSQVRHKLDREGYKTEFECRR